MDPIRISGPAVKNWLKKQDTPGKNFTASDFYIVMWYGYQNVYSCLDKTKIQPMNEETHGLYDKNGGLKKSLSGKKKSAFAEALSKAKEDMEKLKFERMGPFVERTKIPDNCVGKRARITTADGDRQDYLITAIHEPGESGINWRTVDVTSVTRGKALGEGDEDESSEKYEKFDLGQYNFKIVMDVAPRPVSLVINNSNFFSVFFS